MKKELLRMFKAVEIKSKLIQIDTTILAETIKDGFILSPEIIHNYSTEEIYRIIDMVRTEVLVSAEQMNSSFHKSWGKIRSASMERLVTEQIIHYITTYGFESLGIYNKDTVYFPNELLEIPEVKEVPFTVIKGYLKSEIKEKVMRLLKSGIALGEDTIKDVIVIAKCVGIGQNDIDDVKNKEVKIILCDNLEVFPKNPSEFLRYVIYKSIGRTLLIKDKATIGMLKISEEKVFPLFKRYNVRYGLKNLSTIFYRFKPIFLAMKSEKEMKPVINKIKRLAIKYHKPMPVDYLNDVTSMIKNGVNINKEVLYKELDSVNIFRKIRLAYALKYRVGETNSIVYKVRNGKGFATDFNFENKDKAQDVLDMVINSIVKDIKINVDGKKIYIPSTIQYALPATEKQFTGNFPSGTCVGVKKDMVAGVHWNNVKNNRIDLDLSLMNIDSGKIGWNAGYRSNDRSVLFSGDVTNPGQDGASELFYIGGEKEQAFIMMLNYYNYSNIPVPYSIIVAEEEVNNFKKNYMVNPNNVKCISKSKLDIYQKMLGLIISSKDGCKFYFSESEIGKTNVSMRYEYMEKSRRYLIDYNRNTIYLNELLEMAGAILIDNKDECDIDLSPEVIEKDTIMNLLIEEEKKT